MTERLSEQKLLHAAIVRDHLERGKGLTTKGEITEWLRRKGFRRDMAQALAAGKDDIPLSRKERRLLSKLVSMAGAPAIVEQIEERLDAIHTTLGTHGDTLNEFELGVIARDALHAWMPKALDEKSESEQRLYYGQLVAATILSLRKKKSTLEQRRRSMLDADILAQIDADDARDRLRAMFASSLELIDRWRHQRPEKDVGAIKALRVLSHGFRSDSLGLESEVEGDDVAMSKSYVAKGFVEEALFVSDLLGHSRVSILHNAFRLAQMAGDYARTTEVVEVYFGERKDGGGGYANDIAEIRTKEQGGIIDDESEWPGLAVLLLRGDPKKLSEAHRILTRFSGPQYDHFRAGLEKVRELIARDKPYKVVMSAMTNSEGE